MIAFILGAFAGATVGVLAVALARAADDCDCQVPTLGRGSWLVVIDQHGEMTTCRQHVCIDEAFRRLGKTMGDGTGVPGPGADRPCRDCEDVR